MRLLHVHTNLTLKYCFKQAEFFDNVPEYAILSHRWEPGEPNFSDIANGTGHDKPGYRKLLLCAERAAAEGIDYIWADTVCIDKSSSAELTEALNSMYRWYKESKLCYVYLSDYEAWKSSADGLPAPVMADFTASGYFRRGWTLQELLAPSRVEFFDRWGHRVGCRSSLEDGILEATGLPVAALHGAPMASFTVEERMSWMDKRQTTRVEDRAYCLMGIFDVFMPVIYGERERAMRRLREEIAKYQESSSPISISGIVQNPVYQTTIAPAALGHRPPEREPISEDVETENLPDLYKVARQDTDHQVELLAAQQVSQVGGSLNDSRKEETERRSQEALGKIYKSYPRAAPTSVPTDPEQYANATETQRKANEELEEGIMRMLLDEGLLDGVDLSQTTPEQQDEISGIVANRYRGKVTPK